MPIFFFVNFFRVELLHPKNSFITHFGSKIVSKWNFWEVIFRFLKLSSLEGKKTNEILWKTGKFYCTINFLLQLSKIVVKLLELEPTYEIVIYEFGISSFFFFSFWQNAWRIKNSTGILSHWVSYYYSIKTQKIFPFFTRHSRFLFV